MKRLFLSSLLSCMVIGQIGAAASNSGEDARRAEQLERVEKRRLEDERLAACYARVPSLQKQCINASVSARIRAMGGKVVPTYEFNAVGNIHQASEEDVYRREEHKSHIREAIEQLRVELDEQLPIFNDLISLYEQELLSEWSHEWRRHNGAGYWFPPASDARLFVQRDFNDALKNGNQEHPYLSVAGYRWSRWRAQEKYYWKNRVFIMQAIDAAAQVVSAQYPAYKQQLLATVAAAKKDEANLIADGYPITMRGDSVLKSTYLLAGTLAIYKVGAAQSRTQEAIALAILTHISGKLKACLYDGMLSYDDQGEHLYHKRARIMRYAEEALCGTVGGFAVGSAASIACLLGETGVHIGAFIACKLLKDGIPSFYQSLTL